jgi:hypothetical protein
MVRTADVHGYAVAVPFDYGNMLFLACIDAAGDQFGHFLTAAYHFHTGRMDHAHQIAADFAFKKTGFTNHSLILLL